MANQNGDSENGEIWEWRLKVMNSRVCYGAGTNYKKSNSSNFIRKLIRNSQKLNEEKKRSAPERITLFRSSESTD